MYVEPRQVYDWDANQSIIRCVCGGRMLPEQGQQFTDEGPHDLLWWRCIENPAHVTRALPLPVRMARG